MNVAVRQLQTLFDAGCLGGLSDGQLLDRFAERREEAVFEAIVVRHGPMVWGVCSRVLRDHHDAQDAFQSTFLVVARKAAAIAQREKLSNWLYGVAYQTAMKARATRAKRRGREIQVPNMPQPAVEPDCQRDDLAERLDQELSRLPEKYRIPVVLCDLEGQTHGQAARQLGWPVGTVSSRLSRARALLASRLSRPGSTLSAAALAVLLASESATASVPAKLIGPTARAASLFAAGGVLSAELVPAGVATLTREVMKAMLLSKIKVAMAMLAIASALAAGVTGQAYRAHPDLAEQKEARQSTEALHNRAFIIPRAYQVADLIMPPDCLRDAPMKVDMTSLADVITTHVAPGTWNAYGGGIGSITPDPETMSLVIRHSHEVQNQVGNLLDSLRRLQVAQAVQVLMASRKACPETKPVIQR